MGLTEELPDHVVDAVCAAFPEWEFELAADLIHRAAVAAYRAALGDFAPTRWWRVIYADGSTYPSSHFCAGQPRVWCETSNEDEARKSLETCPGGGVLQRLYERQPTETKEWRDA